MLHVARTALSLKGSDGTQLVAEEGQHTTGSGQIAVVSRPLSCVTRMCKWVQTGIGMCGGLEIGEET